MMWLERPTGKVVALCAISFAVAYAMFATLSSSSATATDYFKGIQVQVGGAFGGFIVTLALSAFILRKFEATTSRRGRLEIAIRGNPPFVRQGNRYTAVYKVINPERGKRLTKKCEPSWRAGGLAVDILDVELDDFIEITIQNQIGEVWQSDSFCPGSPNVDANKG
jgi:hypothetical protein